MTVVQWLVSPTVGKIRHAAAVPSAELAPTLRRPTRGGDPMTTLCTDCDPDAFWQLSWLVVVHQPTCRALTGRGFDPPAAWATWPATKEPTAGGQP